MNTANRLRIALDSVDLLDCDGRFDESSYAEVQAFLILDAIEELEYAASLAPHYHTHRDDMPDGWYWCESLGQDSPPQLLRSYRPMRMNPEDSTFSVAMHEPRVWQRWTIAGWVPLVGRIAPCTGRPEASDPFNEGDV